MIKAPIDFLSSFGNGNLYNRQKLWYNIRRIVYQGPHRRWDAGNPAKGFAGIHFPEIQPMKRGPHETVRLCGDKIISADSIPGPHRRWDAGNPAKGFCGDSRTARKRAQKARNGFRGYSRGKNRGKGLSCRAMLRRAGEWL